MQFKVIDLASPFKLCIRIILHYWIGLSKYFTGFGSIIVPLDISPINQPLLTIGAWVKIPVSAPDSNQRFLFADSVAADGIATCSRGVYYDYLTWKVCSSDELQPNNLTVRRGAWYAHHLCFYAENITLALR